MKLLLLLGIMFDPNIEMRQQTMRLLKEEGMGKDEMEVKVIAEAAKLCEYFIEPHLESEVDHCWPKVRIRHAPTSPS